ncbi:MAG TPA: hypothetical protein VEA16_02765 [Vicinamibacterales bacterium]|nr:hypothetical protein [Vicinamibacterales bacterium]
MLSLLLAGLLMLQQSLPPTRILNPTNPNPTPSDARMTQFDFDVPGSSWRVFSVNNHPEGPVVITQVEEVRQQNPPSTWGVYVGNRELMPVASLTVAAAVVDVNGKVKAIQNVPAIKNLKPQQIVRKEIPIRVTILAPTDRVVFYVREVKSETGDYKAVDATVAELIKTVAQRLPVP